MSQGLSNEAFDKPFFFSNTRENASCSPLRALPPEHKLPGTQSKNQPAPRLSTPAEHFDRHPAQARQETGLKSTDPHAGPSDVSPAINLLHDQHVAELLGAEVDSGTEGDSGAFTKRRLTSNCHTGRCQAGAGLDPRRRTTG